MSICRVEAAGVSISEGIGMTALDERLVRQVRVSVARPSIQVAVAAAMARGWGYVAVPRLVGPGLRMAARRVVIKRLHGAAGDGLVRELAM